MVSEFPVGTGAQLIAGRVSVKTVEPMNVEKL
jgi:hypothetical protein